VFALGRGRWSESSVIVVHCAPSPSSFVGMISADEAEEDQITISTLGFLFSPSTTMHSDAFDVIPFEVQHKCSTNSSP